MGILNNLAGINRRVQHAWPWAAVMAAAGGLACRPPPANRPEVVATSHTVDGINVRLAPVGYVFWAVEVNNTRNEAIRLVWDESTFVAGDGIGRGRLLRGSTRRIDSANPQPPTPIGPHSKVQEVFVPEQLMDYKPDLHQSNGAPADVTSGVGRMVLAFDGPRGRETWEATLHLDGRPVDVGGGTTNASSLPGKPPTSSPRTGFFCASSPTQVTVSTCARDRSECESARETIATVAADMGPCALVESSSCVSSTDDPGKRRCAATSAACEAQRQRLLDAAQNPSRIGPCHEER